jgi:tetratricopeptide (TPR) repeat protein
VEDGHRAKPPERHGAGPAARILGGRTATIGLIALAGALALTAVYWSVRGGGSVAHKRGLGFPAPPNLDSAIASAETRLKENPQDINALVQLGVLHFEKGKDSYIDAINELEEARDLGALDTRVFYCLGIMYQDAGLYSFALEEYKRFLRNHPEDKEVRLLTAKLLYQQSKFSDAVEEYERLKYHFPKDPLIEENLGLSLWGAKQYDQALESFKALKGFGEEPAQRAELYLGQVELEREQFQSAVEHFKAVVGYEPAKVAAGLGAAYKSLKMPDESREAWKKVLELVPDDAKAKAALKDLDRRFPPKKQKAQKPKK